MTLLSTTRARSRRLIVAGYRDAKRELTRLRRARGAAGAARDTGLEVEPAFRHEVA
jgi:hypothetical protein